MALYPALKETHIAYASLAAVLAFAGITLVLATPSALSFVSLSDKYAAATTEAQRSQLLASGEAILASDLWHGTGANIGAVLLQTAGVLVSVIMLGHQGFGDATAYVGIVTHGLDLAHISLLFLIALEIAIFGFVPGVNEPEFILGLCWSCLFAGLGVLLFTFVAGFAHDIRRRSVSRQAD